MNIDFKLRSRRVAHDEGETPALFHGLACKGNSSTQANPTTSNQVTDQRVAASEGSVSAGSGATVNIESSDAAVVTATGDAISRVAMSANDAVSESARVSVNATAKAAGDALNANVDVSRAALDTGRAVFQESAELGRSAITAVQSQGRDALDFGDNIVSKVLDNAAAAQQSTNSLIQRTNEQFTAKLAGNAGEAPQALAGDVVKYVTIAAGIVAAVLLFRGNPKN